MLPSRVGHVRDSPLTHSINPNKFIRSSSYQSINKSFEIESLSGRILEATKLALNSFRANQEMKKSRGTNEICNSLDLGGVSCELRLSENISIVTSHSKLVRLPRSQKRSTTVIDENYNANRASLTNESHDKQIPKPSSIRFRSPFKSD